MPYMKKLYQELATLVDAYHRCVKTENDWADKHEERIEKLVDNYMPSGSGIDSGTKLDLESSTGYKLVFTFGYHHMDENGMYDGWTDHKCIVRPSLMFGKEMRITGRNRNYVKEYLYEVFDWALCQEIDVQNVKNV